VLQALGFQLEIVPRIPGPQDYAAGIAVAGRFQGGFFGPGPFPFPGPGF
jgi:hypothetical protein